MTDGEGWAADLPKPGANWADDEEEAAGGEEEAAPAAPPGFGAAGAAEATPPTEPELEVVAPPTAAEDEPAPTASQTEAADAIADQLQKTVEVDDEGDAPAAEPAEVAEELNLEVRKQEGIYSAALAFEDLSLTPELLKGLYTEMKFNAPSKIQAETLPMIVTPPHANLIAQAQNGSGKTTCFTLGMLSRCDASVNEVQALCICDTRELVQQNKRVLEKMGKHTGLRCVTTADEGKVRDTITAHVVIGTPGTLKNWCKAGRRQVLRLDGIKILVFDEADRMMEQGGFADDSVKIMKMITDATSRRRVTPQVLLFSATFSDQVMRFCQSVVPEPRNQVLLKPDKLRLDAIKQFQVVCPNPEDKTTVLKERILNWCDRLGQAIVFVRTKTRARALHEELAKVGHKCTSLMGSMEAEDRDRVTDEFREGKTKILVCTDVLSRGFDQSTVTLVVNYDAPTLRDQNMPAFETYLHRIGRSGRFGNKGAAFNLVCGATEQSIIDQIATHYSHPIQAVPYNDEEAFQTVLEEAELLTPEGNDDDN